MAGFGRSNSLSINTSGSLFGNNASQAQPAQGQGQGQQSAGLFGSSSQPQTGGLFGGAQAAASQPPQSAGLFGALGKPATTPGTGNLFGASAQTSQPQQQTAAVFGGALGGNQQSNIGQTSQSGGLFGGNLGQSQQQMQRPALSLFNTGTQQQPQQQQQQQQQQNPPSLFGASNAQPQAQNPQPSLFGSTQQTQQPQQQNTLFGGMQSTRQPLTLGGHTITGPGLPPASTSGLNVTDISSVKGTTRYSDLDRSIQQQIQAIDDGIQGHISNAARVREVLPGQDASVATIAPDVAYVEQFLSTVELGILNDSANIEHLKALVKKDIDDAGLSIRAVENLKLPNQFHYNRSNLNTSTSKPSSIPAGESTADPTKPVDLVSYFSARADELNRTHDTYNQQIREIEAHLRTMEAGTLEKAQQLTGSRSASKDQKRELVEALRAIEGAINEAAKKVTNVSELVTQEIS
ncbi:hypothetical protein P154DRAFT_527927 [Amniculicola lignicola CBS 123094]|uniref:Nucleoporin Nup54 alpha-helical domain-containing protein n=1 Tax=Amniculicola lignicola CBS 123094 TaxID=1392246 RepID=A0A6A5VZA9_9PLEO|nr:hypothetical protein P154DRAFT_527927 [Amniculicola lignicola CBS 123094]